MDVLGYLWHNQTNSHAMNAKSLPKQINNRPDFAVTNYRVKLPFANYLDFPQIKSFKNAYFIFLLSQSFYLLNKKYPF